MPDNINRHARPDRASKPKDHAKERLHILHDQPNQQGPLYRNNQLT